MPAQDSKRPPKGFSLEARVQTLVFAEGYYAARNIFLPSEHGAVTLPDLDVVGVKYSPDFVASRVFYDCKSGKSQAVGRVMWLKSVAARFGAHRIALVRPNTPSAVKLSALADGVHFIDGDVLNELEQRFVPAWLKDYLTDPDTIRAESELTRAKDKELARAARFIRQSFWFLPAFSAVKQAVARLNEIGSLKTVPGVSSTTVAWAKTHLVGLFILGTLRVAAEVCTLSTKERESYIRQRLVSDRIPLDQFNDLMITALEYGRAVYANGKGIDPREVAILPPPDYAEAYVDLIGRVLARAQDAVQLPRLAWLSLSNIHVRQQELPPDELTQLFGRPLEQMAVHLRDHMFFLAEWAPNSAEFVGPLLPSKKAETAEQPRLVST